MSRAHNPSDGITMIPTGRGLVVSQWTGHEVTALRGATRSTVTQFAAELGVSARSISSWEARDTTIEPTPEMQACFDERLSRLTTSQLTIFSMLCTDKSRLAVAIQAVIILTENTTPRPPGQDPDRP